MTTETDSGEAGAFWQYPVKSMMGEELNVLEVTERGLHCDRGVIVA
ncbi:MAG: MOSC N-terminal beta barrel domain-containing protein [Nitrospirota bacterium]|nr:MOSC N-terminal beta barrel domain-containing protein [Nitrospirota bacterium]